MQDYNVQSYLEATIARLDGHPAAAYSCATTHNAMPRLHRLPRNSLAVSRALSYAAIPTPRVHSA